MASTRWCFTINNPSAVDEAAIAAWDTKYSVFGREKGDSGTPHLQGFCTFPKLYRLSGVKKLHATAHWEIAKGTSKEASDYCKKDGDFVENGEPPFQGKRTDLEAACDAIKAGTSIIDVAMEFTSTYAKFHRGLKEVALLVQPTYRHDTVRGVWFHGEPGTGKSHTARAMYPNAYMKAQNKWFDGYAGEAVIILDDLDIGGKCLGHHLKIWLDKYPCTGETKGGTVSLQHRVFIITSNHSPDELFSAKSQDDDNGESVMVQAIERRLSYFRFTRVFEPPSINQTGPGNWEPEVDPPLPASFYNETQVDP